MIKNKFTFFASLIFWLLLVIIIFVLSFKLYFTKKELSQKLNFMKIFILENDSLSLVSGKEITSEISLLSPEAASYMLNFSSPFNDSLSFRKINKKYVRNKYQDYYGAPRRTGKYKRIHDAIDWFVPENTKLYPLAPIGIVTDVCNDENGMYPVKATDNKGNKTTINVEYGKYVRIMYPEGLESMYVHMNEVYVNKGDIVNKKTCVGISGYTGNIKNSGKPSHLHMEFRRKDNSTFDPLSRVFYNDYNFSRFFEKLDYK